MQLNPSLAKARANLALEKATPAGGDAAPSALRRVMGVPARIVRQVPEEQLLEQWS